MKPAAATLLLLLVAPLTLRAQCPPAPHLTIDPVAYVGEVYTLRWDPVPGATAYIAERSEDSSFSTVTLLETPDARSSLIEPALSTTDVIFYYRVRARVPGCTDAPYSNSVSILVRGNDAGNVRKSVVPVVAKTAGRFGSFFVTSLQLFNPSFFTPSGGRLVFHPAGRRAQVEDPAIRFALLPRSTVTYDDLLAALAVTGLGSLDVIADSGELVEAVARIEEQSEMLGGSYGVTERSIVAADVRSGGAFVVPDQQKQRMNIGVRTLGGGALLEIRVTSAEGVERRRLTAQIDRDWFSQVTAEEFTGGTLESGDSITVAVEGLAIVYAAVTDNATNDPSIDFARPTPFTGSGTF